ncbi:efflux RND transporter periplasmic adaptor subunit [Desulfolutivibrio sulfoxidireducens]|uniref:efflux RND transporter periplasmic adaptor subunit n=1 Tax=Desulfolutivibrio sulfoxidireducens TaxID=2773299 RepID=UPI00159D7B8A|nr:efflux RND transporter periplasmic adaptor subunit [Desulfolutivibrio sulfoxidireducens]QLA16127.1 efflux RND transporter periplasmic adaptor subunit [Desulfolutivibrio sulfoxidireducens]
MFAVMVVVALVACSGDKDKAGPKTARPVPVTVAPVVKKTVPVNIQAVGNVESMASVAVKTQVGGLLVEQYVSDGHDVAEGDRLFLIDPRPYELAVTEAEAKIERDTALLQKAEEDLERYARLKEKDVIAKESYDHTLAQARTLRGTIKVNEAERDRARLDLEYATVRSPITGRVGSILLHKGNVIKANDDRTLVVINRIRPIYVSFSVPERHLPDIMARMKTDPVRVEVKVEGDPTPETGVLAAVDNSVDKTTGAIRLKASFGNADAALWPGQFVRVSLNLGERQGAVVVPTSAVQEGLRGPYLYVVRPDNTVETRDLTMFGVVDGETVVETGVVEGETVVVDGQLRLAPGVAVEAKGKTDEAKGKADEAKGKADEAKGEPQGGGGSGGPKEGGK